MATPRDIRRLAFQALYQLDARTGATGAAAGGAPAGKVIIEDPEAVLAGLMNDPEDAETAAARHTPAEIKKAFLMASAAFADRAAADAFMTEAAPGWPAHRQAAVDRAILRLAHYEMVSGETHPKIAVNEAVELAKTFSTEKSPSFINGLLDKLLKQVLAERGELDPASTTTTTVVHTEVPGTPGASPAAPSV
jgi:N utilization substance protein B